MRLSKTMALVGFVLLAGLTACANPADNVPAAAVAEPTEASPSAEGQVFQLVEGSTVGFIGSKVTGSHKGGFRAIQGEITVVAGDPTQSTVHLEIDTTTLWADNEKLTGHLKSPDFFDVQAHPTAEFTSTEIVPAEQGYTITGNLNLHGVTKSISFPATIQVEDGQVTAQAEFFIMRFDFDIEYAGMADDLIRDEVVIQFDVTATPADA